MATLSDSFASIAEIPRSHFPFQEETEHNHFLTVFGLASFCFKPTSEFSSFVKMPLKGHQSTSASYCSPSKLLDSPSFSPENASFSPPQTKRILYSAGNLNFKILQEKLHL